MNRKRFTVMIVATTLLFVIYIYIQFSHERNIRYISNVQDGLLNLSNKDFDKDLYRLDGEWIFYPSRGKESITQNKQYIKVPNNLSNNVRNKLDWQTRYGTYELKVIVPSQGYYCLDLPYMSSAYTIYVDEVNNGNHIKRIEVRKDERQSLRNQIIPFYTDSNEIIVKIKFSSKGHEIGSVSSSVLIGTVNNVLHNSYINMIKSTLIIGIFIGTGLYLVLLFYDTKKKHYFLYLGLFCISALIRESVNGTSILYQIWEGAPFQLIYRLKFITLATSNIAFQLFICSFYKSIGKRSMVNLVQALNVIYLLMVLFSPIASFIYKDTIYIILLIFNIMNGLYVLIRAFLSRLRFSFILTLGYSFLIITIYNEVMLKRFHRNLYEYTENLNLGLLFFLICAIYVITEDILEAYDSSNYAKDMEIAFLQAQIAPHFIFNTLNNIYCLMGESVPKAKQLILEFSNFLRVKHKFDYRKQTFYSLKEEIEMIKSYIHIENVGLDGCIHFSVNINEKYERIPIPQLILQPLVENAIRYARKRDSIQIELAAFHVGDQLRIIVTDNGKGMNEEQIANIFNKNSKNGVGLCNINHRLKKCYQTNLKIISEPNIGTKVFFDIPLSMKN